MWILPYIAAILFLSGNLFLAKKQLIGWPIQILSSLSWMIYGLSVPGGLHVAMASIAYIPVQVYGIINWKRKNKNDN